MVQLDCGSRSTRSVFFFFSARAAARLMDVVVFPTPPFWLAIARTQVNRRPSLPSMATAGPYMAPCGSRHTTSRPTLPISAVPLQAKSDATWFSGEVKAQATYFLLGVSVRHDA